MFYTSLTNDYHFRLQSFIHSCGSVRLEDLDRKQLDFRPIHDRIELREYNVRTPRWYKRKDDAPTPDRARQERNKCPRYGQPPDDSNKVINRTRTPPCASPSQPASAICFIRVSDPSSTPSSMRMAQSNTITSITVGIATPRAASNQATQNLFQNLRSPNTTDMWRTYLSTTKMYTNLSLRFHIRAYHQPFQNQVRNKRHQILTS